MPSETRTIAVTGDVSIDWLLLSSASHGRGAVDFIWMWGRDYIGRALSSRGGAALHAEILRAAASQTELQNLAVVGPTVPIEALASPFHPAYTHTFASLQRFARETGESGWRSASFRLRQTTKVTLSSSDARGGCC